MMRTLDWANPPAVIGYSEEGALIGCSEAEALIGCSEEGELQQYEWTVAERKRLGWVDADGGSRERSRLKLIMAADAVYDTDATEGRAFRRTNRVASPSSAAKTLFNPSFRSLLL